MPSTLGSETKTIIVAGVEAHKLHQEFTAAGTIKKGQPVKIDPTTGSVVAMASGNNENLCIGISIHNATSGQKVTVAVRGYVVTLGEATASSQNAGPVKCGTYDSTNSLQRFTAAPAAIVGYVAAASAGSPTVALTLPDPAMIGWQLMPSTDADEEIRVLIKD